MTPTAIRTGAVLLALALTGCRSAGTTALAADWELGERAVSFGRVFVGAEGTLTVAVRNGSRAPVALRVEVPAPFTGPEELLVGGGDSAALALRFAPAAAGEAVATVRLSDGAAARELSVQGTGVAVPRCVAESACRVARFELTAGRCVEEPAEDGAPCANACLTGAVCFQGECVGEALSCDDGDACTRDSCDPLQGCRHSDVSASCPAPANPCEVATCRPDTGCGSEAASDGASCGSNDCTTAHVCIAGQCEERPSPDGSQCAAATRCQGAATCHQAVCTPGPETFLPERWRYERPGYRVYFEGTVDADGTTYFTEASLTDPQAALELVGLNLDGQEVLRVELERPCQGCAARLMLDPAGHRLFAGRAGRVQAWSTRTGSLLWSRDTSAGRVLRSPAPDGGGLFSSAAFFSLNPELVVEMLTEGYELHRAYFVALDRTSGRVAWERDWWGHVYYPGVLSDGALWVTQADCWAAIQQSQVLDAAGLTVATVARQARPVAFRDDLALLTTGSDYVWASRRGLGAPLVVPGRLYPWYGLSAPDRTVLVGNTGLEEYDEDGGRRWGRNVSYYLATAVLLTDGGTLMTEYSGDGGSRLNHLDSTGGAVFTCPLPGRSNAGAVAGGLYIANLGTGLQDTAIVAFEAPGLEPQPTGWTGPGGGPWNDHRVH